MHLHVSGVTDSSDSTICRKQKRQREREKDACVGQKASTSRNLCSGFQGKAGKKGDETDVRGTREVLPALDVSGQ